MLLRCESLEPRMSVEGQKRPWCHVGSNVRFVRKQTSIDGRQGRYPGDCRHSCLTAVMERATRLLRLDVCELHDLAPLFDFFNDQFSVLSRRATKRRVAKIGKPRLDL